MATIDKTVNKTADTTQPTGLTVERSGMKFILTWKFTAPNHGAGQTVQMRTSNTKGTVKDGPWNDLPVSVAATSVIATFDAEDYYPGTSKNLEYLVFRVRGKQSPTTTTTSKQSGSDTIRTTTHTTYRWSDWRYVRFNLQTPNAPVLTATLDSESDSKTTFSWTTDTSTTDHRAFADVQYQTILVRACTETNGSKLAWKSSTLGWGTGTTGASGSITRTEQTELLAADSYTRWVRVRSRGAYGASKWVYARHVYATPYRPVIQSIRQASNAANAAYRVTWKLKADAAHPVDLATLQYQIGNPAGAGLVPSYNDSDWTDGPSVSDTTGDDAVQFTIDRPIGTDECLWVRLLSIHDRTIVRGTPWRAAAGTLATPSGLTVTNAVMAAGTATITATNEAEDDVPDSRLAVVCRRKRKRDIICGVIPHGEISVNVTVDPWTTGTPVSFGVYAFQGSYRTGTVNANMTSDTVWDGGDVPLPPTYTTATMDNGEIVVEWTYSWNDATGAEVSWSTDKNAWESTNEPDTYVIDRTRGGKLRISGLEMGNVYYVRVRQIADGDETVYGPYCSVKRVDLAEAPGTPLLSLSAAIIRPGRKSITARWEFDAPDGTKQAYAEICQATVSGETVTYGSVLAKASTGLSATIKTSGWADGTTKYLCVRVTGKNGLQSDWSDPVAVSVASPLSVAVSQWSLTTKTITDPDSTTRTVRALTGMPLTVTVTGAGAGGTTTVAIERAETYQMDRPNEDVHNGCEGETVLLASQMGEEQITFGRDDLIGYLDDGAAYRLVAAVQDGLGQYAEKSWEFVVLWNHQAIMPTATAQADAEDLIVKITPVAPAGTASNDVVDIYRLSADKPQLIVEGGAWGTQYVDPYPALGEFGGHRVVFRTANGDYITADNHPAWIDLGAEEGDTLDVQDVIIDFGGDRVRLPYNIDLSHSWRKDFVETHYLGGSVQGDWNPGVSRTGSIGSVAIATEDQDTIRGLRRLAVFPGICHVRTPEGSSFSADVQVSESRAVGMGSKLANFSLSVTRVDPERLDGMTYADWIDEQEEDDS